MDTPILISPSAGASTFAAGADVSPPDCAGALVFAVPPPPQPVSDEPIIIVLSSTLSSLFLFLIDYLLICKPSTFFSMLCVLLK